MVARTEEEAWQHIKDCRYAKHGSGRACVTHDVYPAELPSGQAATLPDVFEQIIIAVERNDRVLLQEQFVRLMFLQDAMVHREDRCLRFHHGLPVRETFDREDGIDWRVWVCGCGCGEWGSRW